MYTKSFKDATLLARRPEMQFLLLLCLLGALNHIPARAAGRPEFELTKEFAASNKCPFLEVSGTNTDLIGRLAAGNHLPVPSVLVLQNAQDATYLTQRKCQVVFARSEPGLELAKLEALSHGSSKSLLIVTGSDHTEVKSVNTTRPVIYVEEATPIHYLHILCPRLHREGNWHNRVGYWHGDSETFRTLVPLINFCPHALVDASVNVAWAISQG